MSITTSKEHTKYKRFNIKVMTFTEKYLDTKINRLYFDKNIKLLKSKISGFYNVNKDNNDNNTITARVR